jgi:hypothetical protein
MLLISSEVTALPVVVIAVRCPLYCMMMSVLMDVRMEILLAEVLRISELRRRRIMCMRNVVAALLMLLSLALVLMSVMMMILVFSLWHC